MCPGLPRAVASIDIDKVLNCYSVSNQRARYPRIPLFEERHEPRQETRLRSRGPRLQIWTCTGASNQAWVLPGGSTAPTGKNLDDPAKKDVAMQLVSAAENSSLDWRAQFRYIEDIHDGRGYTAGIIGFCSGTGDMLELVEAYTATKPSNVLAKYLPALRAVNNTDSHAGLDPNFTRDWVTAAGDSVFQAAQDARALSRGATR
jgi:chitosanase